MDSRVLVPGDDANQRGERLAQYLPSDLRAVIVSWFSARVQAQTPPSPPPWAGLPLQVPDPVSVSQNSW